MPSRDPPGTAGTTFSNERGSAESDDGDRDELQNEGIRNFYRMMPQMQSLTRLLDSKRKKHHNDLGKVLSRGANSALTGKDVIAAQRQRMNRKEINAGCGFDSPANRPYKAFGEHTRKITGMDACM